MSLKPSFTRRATGLGAAALAVALAGGFGVTAIAQPYGGVGGMHGGRMGHAEGPMMGGMFGGRGMDRMLDSVNATADQRAQIQRIVEASRKDMQGQRDANRALREQGMTLFSQPTVDANAVEQLRQQMLAQHDQASKRAMQTMLDVSRVLTPEQRTELGRMRAERHERFERRWGRDEDDPAE